MQRDHRESPPLYGVTMQEAGISKILSAKLTSKGKPPPAKKAKK